MQRSYHFNLGKIHLSWFSDNPNIALGIENELRLVRMRATNPDIIISLIYSASILSEKAVNSLTQFCAKHKIQLTNFDTEIMPLLSHKKDIKMYQIARKELFKTVRKKGGNFVGTSDCLRLLVPVLERFGIYKDFDVECHITTTAASGFAPMILNLEADIILERVFAIYPNTDMLAFAHAENNPDQLHDDAVTTIRELQKRIIRNYDGKLTIEKLFHADELNNNDIGKSFVALFHHFHQTKYPQNVFGFRQFLTNFTFGGAQGEHLAALQFIHYNTACSRISGPSVFWSLYQFLRPKTSATYTYGALPVLKEHQEFITCVLASLANAHPVFKDAFTLTNSRSSQNQFIAKHHRDPVAGDIADLSWTQRGKQNKAIREEKMLQAATCIQRFFRRHESMTSSGDQTPRLYRK